MYHVRIRVQPNVYIIAGPNGAGKTTFAKEFLANYADCRQFINADLIAYGLTPVAPQTAAIRAGRLVLEQFATLAAVRESFGLETTLSGRSYLRLLREIKDAGYTLTIFYLWVPVDLAVSRVHDRVLKGGHDVPERDIRRRYERSLRNFFAEYRSLVDQWTLFDNSSTTPQPIAELRQQLRIINAEQYQRLREGLAPRA